MADCLEFCSVQVKVEDTEVNLEPECMSENEDESYQALAAKDAGVCSIVSCKHPSSLFSKEQWPKVTDAFPKYGFKDIQKEISRRWVELDEATRNEYKSRIKAAKEVYYPTSIEKDADFRYIVSCKQPWTLFCKEEWPKVKALHPHFEFRDISKEVGRRWTLLDDASKKEYKARIDVARAMYSPLMAQRDAELRSLCKHPYSLFSKEQWHLVKAENPEFGFREISKEVSNRWAQADEGVKNVYRIRVEAAKARFNEVWGIDNIMVRTSEQPSAVNNFWPETEFGQPSQVLNPFPEPEFGGPSKFVKPFPETELEAKENNHVGQVDTSKFLLVPEEFYRQKKPELKTYPCDKCNRKFSKKELLREHNRILHPRLRKQKAEKPIAEIKTYPCKQCSQPFSRKKDMEKHIRTAHPKGPFECTECSELFPLKMILYDHMRYSHPPERLPCNECDRTFSTKQQLLIHQITHSDNSAEFIKLRNSMVRKEYECDICLNTKGTSQLFKSKHQIARHKICVHMFPKGLKCEECGKIYRKKSQLQRHQIASHSAAPYVCDKCGKKFVKEMFYKRHRRREHRKSLTS